MIFSLFSKNNTPDKIAILNIYEYKSCLNDWCDSWKNKLYCFLVFEWFFECLLYLTHPYFKMYLMPPNYVCLIIQNLHHFTWTCFGQNSIAQCMKTVCCLKEPSAVQWLDGAGIPSSIYQPKSQNRFNKKKRSKT